MGTPAAAAAVDAEAAAAEAGSVVFGGLRVPAFGVGLSEGVTSEVIRSLPDPWMARIWADLCENRVALYWHLWECADAYARTLAALGRAALNPEEREAIADIVGSGFAWDEIDRPLAIA